MPAVKPENAELIKLYEDQTITAQLHAGPEHAPHAAGNDDHRPIRGSEHSGNIQ
jgi:hypothetical protein